MVTNTFNPPQYIRHPAVQTVLASIGIRKWGFNAMLGSAKNHLLNTGNGIRLSGYHSPQTKARPKGLVILLHGWEGSSESTYILSCGRYLYRNGYAVFRLNFRDHGNSHHLNRGLFYATRLEEVYQGVKKAARLSGGLPVFLVGFSLGGNFALRIAKRCAEAAVDHLKHIVSISPVLDPDRATDKIDANPFILSYFIRKWKKSLALKQRIFSEHYDFNDILQQASIRKMTEMLLERYSTYPDALTYFRAYGIYGDDPAGIQLPTTIITAADDPIIPIGDFYSLKTAASTDLMVLPNGGHNGFIEGVFKPAWYDRLMLAIFEKNE